MADNAVYFFDGNVEPASLLRYDLVTDTWSTIETPFQDPAWWSIAEVPGGLVAYVGGEEAVERPDFVLDAATGQWSEVPPDPLSRAMIRWVAGTDDGWVLFDQELVRNPGSERPAVVRAAAYDPTSGSWRRLTDSEVLYPSPFVSVGGQLVNPMLGGADGGSVGGWGREYPNGGILDPVADAWRPLPTAPGDTSAGMGVVPSDHAYYGLANGYVLDVEAERWVEVPSLQGERRPDGTTTTDRRAVTAAGRDLFVFGGTRWSDDGMDGEVLGDAWLWTPPA